jgi:hypothetical protein
MREQSWGKGLWREMIQDHGFNATPAWVVAFGPIISLFPIEALKILCWSDLVLLLGAILGVGWAYGRAPALWTALFLLVTYSARWPTLTHAVFRYEWVVAMLLATALLKKGRPFLAGLAGGWAGAMRFFPALYLWGPLAKGLWGLGERRVERRLLVLAGGFLVAVAVLYGGAVLVHGSDPVTTHFSNMMDHNSPEQLSSRRIGLAMALAYQGAVNQPYITNATRELVGQQEPLRYALAILGILALGWALRRARDDEAYAFGFVPFFLITTASYYYYVARLPLIPVHADQLQAWRHRLGLAALFGLEVFSNASEYFLPGKRVFLVGLLAWGLTIYAVSQIAWMIWDSHRRVPAAVPPAG